MNCEGYRFSTRARDLPDEALAGRGVPGLNERAWTGVCGDN